MTINTVADALKGLYKKVGGADDLANTPTVVDVLKSIYAQLGGTDDVANIPTTAEMIEKITEVAEGGGGGGIENVALVVTNGHTSDGINLVDYFEAGYPSIINNTLKTAYLEDVFIEAHESYTLYIAHSSVPTEVFIPDFADEPEGSGNIVVTHDEEREVYKLTISGDCAITMVPVG